MAKFNKQYYFTKNNEKKLHCVKATLSKELIKEAGIEADDEIKIYVKGNKIIIEKV